MEGDVSIIKCRKCRTELEFGERLTKSNENPPCCASFESIFPINLSESTFPDWIYTCLDEGEWCKGKIFCPKCRSKLGCFDFVSGTKCACSERRTLPEIHLSKCKIDITSSLQRQQIQNDVRQKLSLEQFIRSKSQIESKPNNKANPLRTHRKTNSWHSTTMITSTFNTLLGNLLQCRSKSVNKLECFAEIHPQTSAENTSSKIAEKCVDDPQNSSKSLLHESTPLPPYYLLCSVCLDVFCLPRMCQPCGHTFCEPCLRLLADARQNPSPISSLSLLKVLCPLCRQIIHFTHPNKETLEAVKLNFNADHRRRLIWYKRQADFRRRPLPGLHSWTYVHGVVHCLPDALSRRLTRFSPLTTLYSLCLTFLCLLFFFTCFVPAVYVSTYVFAYVERFDVKHVSEYYELFVEEIGALVGFLFGNAVATTSVSIFLATSIALYFFFIL